LSAREPTSSKIILELAHHSTASCIRLDKNAGAGWVAADADYNWQVYDASGNAIMLNFIPVPEPSTLALLAGVGLRVARRRRR
jgi:hypothetical protein